MRQRSWFIWTTALSLLPSSVFAAEMSRSSMRRRKWFIWTVAVLLLPSSVFAAEMPRSSGAFDSAKLDSVLKTLIPAITGQPGRWEGVFDGIPVLILSQDVDNRLHVVAPVAQLEALDVPILLRLLEANFTSTVDARYALFRGVLWSVFLHPLDSLTEPQLRAGLQQVVTLAKNTLDNLFEHGSILREVSPEPEGLPAGETVGESSGVQTAVIVSPARVNRRPGRCVHP